LSANGDNREGIALVEGEQLDAAPGSLAMFEPDECGEGMSPSSLARAEEQALRDIIAPRLVRARRAAGLKDLEVAQRLGHANLTMISLFENGRRSISVKNLQVLADLYNVTTDYLLGRTDDLGLSPEEGNQALITGVLTAVVGKYNQRYLEGLAQVMAIGVEGASMDRVLLGRVADISVELSDSLGVIRKHHGAAFESLRGGGKLERLISELSVSVKDRISSKQRESALIEFDHPVCTVQQVTEAVQQALF
jgi:transcriptional regulator with XRE-family HTH domain